MRNTYRKELIALARETNSPECWCSVVGSLSRIQQKILLLIYELDEPPVKELARRSFLPHQDISSQLTKLKKLGLVRYETGPEKRRRESLYFLRDRGLQKLFQLNDRTRLS